jgi:hypothetical protein
MVDALAAVQAAEAGNTTCVKNLVDEPFEACSPREEFSGTALPGGFAVMDQNTDLLGIHPVDVPAGVDALYAQINWLNPADNIYLFLFDPEGNEVEASAGLLDVPIDQRQVLTTYPEPGEWTIVIAGRVNTATPYDGWFGMYCHIQDACEPERERTAMQFEGSLRPGLDETGERVQFEIEVPEATESLFASVSWDDPNADLDLYIRDPDGSTRASAATADNNPEAATAFGADPVAAGVPLEPGTWIVEVHGWLVVEPADFVVDVILTTIDECILADVPAGDTDPQPAPDGRGGRHPAAGHRWQRPDRARPADAGRRRGHASPGGPGGRRRPLTGTAHRSCLGWARS